MRIARLLTAVAATLVMASGCGGTAGPGTMQPGSYLEQGRWDLTSIDELRVTATGSQQPWFRLSPAEGRVEGSTGCNSFNGPYRAGGTTVTFGPLAVTRRACADPAVSEVERRMLEVMQAADSYHIEGGSLQLRVQGSIRMIFVPAR